MSEKSKVKEIAINISISIASIIFVLLALELSLQLGVLGTGNVSWIDACKGEVNRYNYHSSYGWTWPPGSQYLIKRTEVEDWDRYTINNQGFRDTYDKGNRTAIVLGDSHTFGMLADDNSTFSHLLDYWSENMSFRNYGMMGYGTAQQLEVYKNVSKDTDHDLVILTYYLGNDAKDNVNKNSFSGKRPLYELQNGSLNLTYQPERMKIGALKKTYFNTPLRHFISPKYLYHKFLNARTYFRSGGSSNGSDNSVDRRLNLTEALVSEISELSQKNGARLVIATLPRREEVRCSAYPNACERDKGYWERQRRMLDKITSRSDNTEEIGLLKPLKRNENTYGDIDAHINEKGHRIVAETLYNSLAQEGFVEKKRGLDMPDEASECSPP